MTPGEEEVSQAKMPGSGQGPKAGAAIGPVGGSGGGEGCAVTASARRGAQSDSRGQGSKQHLPQAPLLGMGWYLLQPRLLP